MITEEEILRECILHSVGSWRELVIYYTDRDPFESASVIDLSEHILNQILDLQAPKAQEEVQGVDFGESKEWMMDTASNKKAHAERLLERFAAQCLDILGNGSLEALQAAKEACLAAMLGSEKTQVPQGEVFHTENCNCSECEPRCL